MAAASSSPRTILYVRVSTAEQTGAHQLEQARKEGFVIDKVVEDIASGVARTLAERPNGRRLFDLLRAGDTLVVRWVDRLGRNYGDVCAVIREFMDRGVVVRTIINRMVFDGSAKSPMEKAVRDALIGFMAATAEAQAEATREAQRAGIAHARLLDNMEGVRRYRGRKPSYGRAELEAVRTMVREGAGTSDIARATGLTRQTVLRIRADEDAAASVLRRWEAQ
ncbi:MAG: recombinase family protein [Bauldia sp.]|nr:recombinase family protein [Bauldia sp.]